MATESYHPLAIVDNPSPDAPAFPDVARLGKSRIGKKLLRKALDAYYCALRRHEGRPAESGPPIPNSEKNGRREYWTLRQTVYGGRQSGKTRWNRAQPKWRKVETLRRRGFGIRQIARAVGYSAGWVSKLVKRLCPAVRRVFPEHVNHQTHEADPRPVWSIHGSRVLTLAVLYRRRALDDVIRDGGNVIDRNLHLRQFATAQRRIIGRRGKRRSSGLLGVMGSSSGIALGMALYAQQELHHLPIHRAVQEVNRAFGWS